MTHVQVISPLQTKWASKQMTWKATVPEELRQTVGSRLWLTKLEVSAAITPSMPLQPSLPRQPHPDGPTPMTMAQLLDAQLKLDQAHQQ